MVPFATLFAILLPLPGAAQIVKESAAQISKKGQAAAATSPCFQQLHRDKAPTCWAILRAILSIRAIASLWA